MPRIRVAALGDLPQGTGRRFDAAGSRVALFRVGDEVFALADRCSHDEASLSEGEVSDCTVECPRHGAAFDLRSGEALSLPATRGVGVFRVEVEADDMWLWVEPGGEEAT